MKSYPKISIVTPSFNQGKYLENTIHSIIDQKYPNLEYIIIDGGSTDNSIDIIKKHEKHISYWESNPDKGMYHAIQKGFDISTGDIMAWSNSDDLYVPNSFYCIAEIFTRFNEVEWIHGINLICDEKDRIVDISHQRQWSKFYFYFNDYKWISQQSVFWRRSLWEKAGNTLNLKLKYAGDYELWSRFFENARLYRCTCCIGIFRKRADDQFSLNRISDYQQEIKQCRQNHINKDLYSFKLLLAFLLHKTLLKIPFIEEIFNNFNLYRKLLSIAPIIRFNREKQSYILK